MMKTVYVMLGALLLTSPSKVLSDSGLVVRRDYSVDRRWELPEFLGKDFYPLLVWWGLASPTADVPPGYDVYRRCALSCRGKRNPPMKGPFRGKYSLMDFYAGSAPAFRKFLSETNDLSRPLFLEFDGVRVEWNLADAYPLADRAGFEKWRAAHPNFFAHKALIEFDCECFGYPARFRKASAEEMHRLEKAYPAAFADYADNVYFRDGWVRAAFNRAAEYGFGCTNIAAMSYWCPGFQMLMADAGCEVVCFEATGAPAAANWSIGAAYMRGAARLFRKPSWWYTASVYGGYTRDGKRISGENRRLGGPDDMYGRKKGWWGPDNGLSRSLVAWQNAYGWLQGAMFVEPENAHHYHLELAPDGSKRPSAFADDFNRLYEMSLKIDRGVPYTPLALLFPVHERLTIQGIPEFHRYMEFSRSAAAFTLLDFRNRRKEGVQGLFANSKFGEFWDITCPDVRSPDETAAALAPYKAAVLLGIYRAHSPRKALMEYVERGGTLFVSCDQVRRRLTGNAAGVNFDRTRAKTAGRYLIDEFGRRTELEGTYVLEEGKSAGATALWRDESGNVIAWVNGFGKGKVVTVAAAAMLPYGVNEPGNLEREGDYLDVVKKMRSGELKFSLLETVFARLQKELLPVKVTGDVQWGVNRTKKGFLVWLYNNEGVRHFYGEPEEFDAKKTATVVIEPQGFTPRSVRDAETGRAHCGPVEVPPGRWRLIALER